VKARRRTRRTSLCAYAASSCTHPYTTVRNARLRSVDLVIQRLKVTNRIPRVQTPREAHVELPPTVPWLCGFDWGDDQLDNGKDDVNKEVKRFDRLKKEASSLELEAKQLLSMSVTSPKMSE